MGLKTAIGLMSGTSMDGIDVALIRTDGRSKVERGANAFFPYSPSSRSTLEHALEDAKSCERRADRPGTLGDVEALVTKLHVEAVRAFLGDNKLQPDEIDVLGCHGQTVLHRPEAGYTIQLGDGETLAHETGIDCVYDMRANDMAHGGQGAPLVPVYHQALATALPESHAGKPTVFVNIGGISNITFVDEELVAFDCGPGNALIDQWVQAQAGIPYDQGGMIAAEGSVRTELVEAYLSNPFFKQPVPKSLDRNDFSPPTADAGGVEDVARSLARVTAASILMAQEHLPTRPELWVISGGGRHNPYIMTDLTALAETSGAKVLKAEEVGLDGDAMEAECWAYLAVRSLEKLPLTFPKTTGVEAPVTGGKLARA